MAAMCADRRSNLVESAVAGPGLSARGPALVATGAASRPVSSVRMNAGFVRVSVSWSGPKPGGAVQWGMTGC